MATTTVSVTGALAAADGNPLTGGAVRFELTEWDGDQANDEFISTKDVEATISVTGTISVNLWPNDRGDTGSRYIVSLKTAEPGAKYNMIGRISIPEAGAPHKLEDLLLAGTVTPAVVYAGIITQAQYDAVIQAADDFDDTYLGAKASDPSVDNDGDPLQTGALYFNTTADRLKVYDGAAWINYVAEGDSPTFGNVAVTGTVDGRDVAADGTRLDGIETGADVTDAANVTTAGALMDSELTNIAAVKALDQGVATADSPTFASATIDGAISVTGTGGSVFLGAGAGANDDLSSNNNVFVGTNAGNANTTGSGNSAIGVNALLSNTTGSYNSASGRNALYSNTTGSYNSASGVQALFSNTTGSGNSAIGYQAGRYIANGSTANATGGTSVFLGNGTKANADGEANQIVIGHNTTGNGSNTATLGNTSITDTYLQGTLHFGTRSAIGAESVTGYITIKDAGGTTRKLAVVS